MKPDVRVLNMVVNKTIEEVALKRGENCVSLLIKDTTREEREQIIRQSLDCGGGCENCSSCWLGGGSPFDMYQDYIDGKKEIAQINAEYNARYLRG